MSFRRSQLQKDILGLFTMMNCELTVAEVAKALHRDCKISVGRSMRMLEDEGLLTRRAESSHPRWVYKYSLVTTKTYQAPLWHGAVMDLMGVLIQDRNINPGDKALLVQMDRFFFNNPD